MRSANKPKSLRFLWRVGRNALCAIPHIRRLLFPPEKLSMAFGRGDVDYSWKIFCRHWSRLANHGYLGAQCILEVGPGRNVGTALLWWAMETARCQTESKIQVVLWDVFANARLEPEIWRPLAAALLGSSPQCPDAPPELLPVLDDIAHGRVTPDITYLVGDAGYLISGYRDASFDLIYSHAAIEHAWNISQTWKVLRQITASNGWHSHSIDLADHGSRQTNYIEMLEWSDFSYWLTMRFVPGAINRWRAFQHVDCLRSLGFNILTIDREMRAHLPGSRHQLAAPYRHMSDTELRTTTIDLVARLHE